uniref:Uncharacterized protein n=1 Tax=Wuchereria bancrofti TaxID=6293 RepID=A0AAF5Q3S7_WUCBA
MNNNKYDEMSDFFPAPTIIGSKNKQTGSMAIGVSKIKYVTPSRQSPSKNEPTYDIAPVNDFESFFRSIVFASMIIGDCCMPLFSSRYLGGMSEILKNEFKTTININSYNPEFI